MIHECLQGMKRNEGDKKNDELKLHVKAEPFIQD